MVVHPEDLHIASKTTFQANLTSSQLCPHDILMPCQLKRNTSTCDTRNAHAAKIPIETQQQQRKSKSTSCCCKHSWKTTSAAPGARVLTAGIIQLESYKLSQNCTSSASHSREFADRLLAQQLASAVPAPDSRCWPPPASCAGAAAVGAVANADGVAMLSS